ncbi:HAD-IC family P-type ATPase [Nonomuraea sp. NPDC048826]|uniref:HAD-IC family P-type ATPase n=1 Tax=Nonomuraea sp. NPDC048826 TaxID=3364347 RepID=UPI00371745F4
MLDILPEPVRGLVPRARRVRPCPGGVRVELRYVGGPGTDERARALEDRLLAQGVRRAEVNGALGCVFLGCDPDDTDVDKLVTIVEEYDVACPGADPGVPRVLGGPEQHAKAAVNLGLQLTGSALALTGQIARVPRLSEAVPSFVALADEIPRVRLELERRIGVPAADAILGATKIVSTTLAARPVTLFVDSVAAAGRYVAARAGHRAWAAHETELARHDGAYRHIRPETAARPAPLPRGPLERYADVAGPAALAAHGVAALAGRDHRRGLPLLISGIPKPARHTRDAFVNAVATALAERGALVLDPRGLSRMDRVDTIVLDAAVLTTGRWTIDRVEPLDPGVDPDELHARLYTLLDLTDPGARRELDGWTAVPTDPNSPSGVNGSDGPEGVDGPHGPADADGSSDAAGPDGVDGARGPDGADGARLDWLDQGIRPVTVSRDGTVVALVGLAREPHPMAAALVAAAKDAGTVILSGDDPALARRLGLPHHPDAPPTAEAPGSYGWQDEDPTEATEGRRGGTTRAAVPGYGQRGGATRAAVPEYGRGGEGRAAGSVNGRQGVEARAATPTSVRQGGEARVAGPVDGRRGGEATGHRQGRLVGLVRELQAAGRGVAVVSHRSRRGLSRADLGIGVLEPGRRVPWDADVAGGLDAVHLVLRALPTARKASTRGVWLAASGAVAGTGLAFVGPSAGASQRAGWARDATSTIAMITGYAMGRAAGRAAPPAQADPTPWHAMAVPDVLTRLGTSRKGLTEKAAAARRTTGRAAHDGGPVSLAGAAVRELANPLTPVLAAGAGLSAVVGSVLDAGLIGGVMVTDAVLGGAQRRGADRALHRLSDLTTVTVRVRRPDGTVDCDADTLVPGDVIELRAGDAVPADARLVKASGLEVDESTLTGESQLVAKTTAPTAAPAVAERGSMVYQGTTIAAGSCRAVVVATGEHTEAGRTALLAGQEPPPSGVELRLRELSSRILPAAVGSGVLLMAIDLLRGSPLATALGPAVSMMVAAVPEGLPFVATIAELASAKRLSRRNTLVRNPSTIEALGRVGVLCFDKTGTLTEGHISLGQVSDGRHSASPDALTAESRAVVGAALRAGPAFGGGRRIAHPTDRAVIEGAQALGIAPEEGLRTWERVDELHFEPARGYHAVLGRSERGHLLSVKGAPEVVLGRCSTVLRDGRRVPLNGRTRRALEQEVDRLARQGYRVLAVAERTASSRADLDESRIERLCFLGYLGLADHVRPTAKESVRRLMGAGVRVVMITGDHPSTAEAIAAEIDALNGRRVMTGPEVDAVDDERLGALLPDVAVFARTTPEHKARIVNVLRAAGEVVAVTGDGANDVPAIRLADVGVALGSKATPATRSAADIVVLDDRIETIIDAIVEGRAMWGSVRDALGILLGGNVGEIAFTLGSSLLTRRSALNARQLLLVNLLTDMLPAMAVAIRPPSAAGPGKLLAEGPEASLGSALTRDIYLRAATTAGAATAAWLLARVTGTRGRADTVGLIGLVGAQLMQTLALGHRDRLVVLASLSSLAALGVTVSVPGLSQVFGCRPVGPAGWGVGLGCAAAATLVAVVIEHSRTR